MDAVPAAVPARTAPGPVTLEQLRARDPDATELFCHHVRDRGIAVVRVGDAELALFEECSAVARAYFSGSPARKVDETMGTDGERDWGYVEMAGVKEFWQMRNGAANPFGDVSRRFFDLCTTMGHVVLATLARGLQVPEEHLVERMVDAPDTPLSSTIFRFFHYYATHGAVPACHIHTDIGLITLIPATNWPSLEVMDFERFDWYNFERPLQPHDMMVLCGETLERLSAYYYRAVVHRVAPTVNERISLVYLMRARPDAVLDSVALQSPVLGEIYEDCREPLLVAKFMRHKYLAKKSANFVDPGQGLPLANLRGEVPSQSELDKWVREGGESNY